MCIVSYASLILFCLLPAITYTLEGPNVCTKEISERREVNVPALVPEKKLKFEWCPQFPPRCRVETIEMVPGYKKEIRNVPVNVSLCCDGYSEIRGMCKPLCANDCLHGICSAPDTCECQPGWTGPQCNIACAEIGKDNKDCSKFCHNCHNGATCDITNGLCSCTGGWMGDNCTEPCPGGHYGLDCSQKCSCLNGASCHHVSGKCNCKPGYMGTQCEIECPENSLDPECDQRCSCENDGKCDMHRRKCVCPPGFMGNSCEFRCPQGFYGINCSQKCDCDSNVSNCSNIGACLSVPERVSADDSATANNSVLLTISCLLMLALCLALMALYRYRERWQRLNKQQAFVAHYVARDPNDHVDNPVYAYSNSSETRLFSPPSTNSKFSFDSLKKDFGFLRNSSYSEKSSLHYTKDSPPPPWESLGACSAAPFDRYTNLAYRSPPPDYKSSMNSINYYSKEPIYAEIKPKDDLSQDFLNHYDHPKPTMTKYNDLDRDTDTNKNDKDVKDVKDHEKEPKGNSDP